MAEQSRVFQMLPTLSYGDAVGNDALALKTLLTEMGCRTELYAKNIDGRLPRGTAKSTDRLPRLTEEDVVLYHLASGDELNMRFGDLPCRKVVIYHNITPPEYFAPYNYTAAKTVLQGQWEAKMLGPKVDYCLAVSEYNREDLRKMGYTCPIDVRPILIPFEDYAKKPSSTVLERYTEDGWTNVLFVGRVAPNKKLENVLAAFYWYQKHKNPKSRLFFVGNHAGMESYYRRLQQYAAALGVRNVVFTGHVRFDEILAYYRLADVFLCMSEHEGFCVPLVEAMYFGVPILALAAAAVPGTLGGSGLLVDTPEPALAAELIDGLVKDEALRKDVLESQRERLSDFSYEKTGKRFEELMRAYL